MAPFVSFEGIDGSGKTTQIRLLEHYLKSKGISVVLAREPGGTILGEAIRQVLLHSKTGGLLPISELLLYYASRHQNIHQTICPALQSSNWVLCDRYTDASMAYQGYGRGIPVALIETLNEYVVGQRMPDLTVLIDIDPAVALPRAKQRNQQNPVDEGRFENEAVEFFERVRQGYLKIAASHPTRFRIVDGSQPAQDVHEQVVQLMAHLLGPGEGDM